MRLFFGLSLPGDVCTAAQECAREARLTISGRYVLSENYHITLAFLGDVPKDRLEDARRVLARCTAGFPVPKLTLDGLSYFGKRENGILILRVCSEPALDALHEMLVQQLREADLPADAGPFSPHVTLARHACICDEWPQCPRISFQAEQAHVYLSARDAQNVLRYTPLHTAFFMNRA